MVRAGAEVDGEHIRRTGLTSVRGRDFAGSSGVRAWNQRHHATRAGGYLELERVAGRITLNGGVRLDRFAPAGRASVDPRLSATWRLGAHDRVRAAAGLYHQAPEPAYLDGAHGNPSLGLMRARHLVLGFEHGDSEAPLQVRVEAYDKAYRGLPVEDAQRRFVDDGHGWARGVDTLVAVRTARLEGHVAYSALFARRRHTLFEERGRWAPPERPVAPAFAVPHTLQASARLAIPLGLSLGLGLRLASGAPHTPIVGARPGEAGLIPVYGEPASERLPHYSRLDLAMSRLQPLGGGTLVLFAGLTNALDHDNVFDYAYSPDYTARRPVQSNWGRSLYVGASYVR